ncbi:MAG: hypothetical protein CSA45_03135 [Gammaproteobacteria bacterium]|nr:MAG: hypothetical protein CSA45_03135 [Gammaproteobacteria bacterium]
MLPIILSALCALLWASTGIFVKLLHDLDVTTMLFGRFALASVLALIVSQFVKINRDALNGKMRLITALLMVFYYVSATYAFYLAPVAVAALTVAAAPLFTLIIRLGRKEAIYRHEIIGFGMAFIGLVVFLGQGQGNSPATTDLSNTLTGASLGLLAALLRAVYSSVLWSYQQSGQHISTQQSNRDILLLGTVLLLPFVVSTPSAWLSFDHSSPMWLNLLGLLGLAWLATYIPNILNSMASVAINPTLHNMIGMSTPIAASIMAWVFLGESQTLLSLAAMLWVLLGIGLSMISPARYRKKR